MKLIINQKHEAWSDVARKIAHEIKNPLTPIKLSIDRLKNKIVKNSALDNEEFNSIIQTIDRQVDDIKGLVDEFSSFARMPTPKLEKNNIVDIIDSCILLFDQNHSNISFIKSIDANLSLIECDKSQISRVINNIFINSIYAINSLKDDTHKGIIMIDISSTDSNLIVKISDNGVGIKHEEKILLQPYFSTKDKNIGSGLGLSIVEKIISDHGGIFKIYNQKKITGVTCEFTLNIN